MSKNSLAAIITSLIVGITIFVTTALAQEKSKVNHDWSKLKIIAYQSGRTGFFDPNTGQFCVYDTNLKECIVNQKLTKLGDRMIREN